MNPNRPTKAGAEHAREVADKVKKLPRLTMEDAHKALTGRTTEVPDATEEDEADCDA